MSMIERMARAIYEGRNGSGCKPWSRLPQAHRHPYTLDALNALLEMREPTEGMVDCGQWQIDPVALYQQFIDAALNEQVTG